MTTCLKIANNLTPGEYKLDVTSADTAVTVSGKRRQNGANVEIWNHEDLFNKSILFVVSNNDKQIIFVDADFHGTATVITTITKDGNTIVTCTLSDSSHSNSQFILTGLAEE